MVKIKNTQTLAILGRDYSIADVGDPLYKLVVVFNNEIIYSREYEHHSDALEDLVQRVERYLTPIHIAELKKLDAWNAGKPITDQTTFLGTSWSSWPGVVR